MLACFLEGIVLLHFNVYLSIFLWSQRQCYNVKILLEEQYTDNFRGGNVHGKFACDFALLRSG